MAKVPERDGQAVACSTEQTQLGEGIRWDDRRGELLAVDILAGRVARGLLRKDGLIERVGVYQLPGTVGMIAPIQGDDGWVLGAGRGFVHLALDGTQRTIAQVAPAGTRMNDGACDPQGRFWGGTLADDHHTGGGALYRLDRTGQTEVVLEDLTISNGIGWSPDGRTMYLVDSGPRVVHAFTFDGDRGTISAGRVLVTVPEDIGAPDGMTVDAAGDLWVAIYGGGRVNRYAPDGSLRDVYPIPARECTCCAFGGPGLHRLFVTTATEGWTDEQRRSDLAAGLVYRVDTDATGQAGSAVPPGSGVVGRLHPVKETTDFRSAEGQPSGVGVTVGARPQAQPFRVGPGFIRAGFHATGQGLGEHERGGGLECAAEQAGGAGRLESQGPPVLAARADLGEFHLALRLAGQPRGGRHDRPAGQ